MKNGKFDLEKALNGDELITVDGKKVSNFQLRYGCDETMTDWPYEALVDGCNVTFTALGKEFRSNKSGNDLLLKNVLEEGDIIFVKEVEEWKKRIFLYFNKNNNPVCVHTDDEQLYKNDFIYRALSWPKWKIIEDEVINITIIIKH